MYVLVFFSRARFTQHAWFDPSLACAYIRDSYVSPAFLAVVCDVRSLTQLLALSAYRRSVEQWNRNNLTLYVFSVQMILLYILTYEVQGCHYPRLCQVGHRLHARSVHNGRACVALILHSFHSAAVVHVERGQEKLHAVVAVGPPTSP